MRDTCKKAFLAGVVAVVIPSWLSGCNNDDEAAKSNGNLRPTPRGTPTAAPPLSWSTFSPSPTPRIYAPGASPGFGPTPRPTFSRPPDIQEAWPRNEKTDARFLMQATFGPTRSSLEAIGQTSSYGQWFVDQVNLPPTSHREFYRSRVNPAAGTGTLVAGARSLCAPGSRWHQFSVSYADVGKTISVRDNKVFIQGSLRTEIDPQFVGNSLTSPQVCTDQPTPWYETQGQSCPELAKFMHNSKFCASSTSWAASKFCQRSCYGQGYGYDGDVCSIGWPALSTATFEGYICDLHEAVGGWVKLSTDGACPPREAGEAMPNPAIWFQDSSHIRDVSTRFNNLRPGVLVLTEDAGECGWQSMIRVAGIVYHHSSRIELVENTLNSPATVGGESVCPVAPRTFLNEKGCRLQVTCQLQVEKVCNWQCYLDRYPDVRQQYGATNVRGAEQHYEEVGQSEGRDCSCAATFQLNHTLLEHIYATEQKYVYSITGLKTITSPCGTPSRWQKVDCTQDDCTLTGGLSSSDSNLVVAALQAQTGWLRDVNVDCSNVPANAVVSAGSEVFRHVHAHEHNVYDFTEWAYSHPGGSAKITKWANDGFTLRFPSDHSIDRWELPSTSRKIHYVGRLQDDVDFHDLPSSLKTAHLAQSLGVSASFGHEACGSIGEVANNPDMGHRLSFFAWSGTTDVIDERYDDPYQIGETDVMRRSMKTSAWITIAMSADDQLRQRVAWALAQIFVVSSENFGEAGYTELWVNYYDIFVRHAFGNFRDILREVTYSPLMGEYLTFRGNTAYDHNSKYPDENYAREIMQLFTIGLQMLNPDGSLKLDAAGKTIPTYSNEHITNFARVLTGFVWQQQRANVEHHERNTNWFDPMMMEALFHDAHPKPDLLGGFLGDGYPLCVDLPRGSFLSAGAKYQFVGFNFAGTDLLTLESSSQLYAALRSSLAASELQAELRSTLQCHGAECTVENPRFVKAGSAYYEYVPPVCVYHYFYNGHRMGAGHNFHWAQCVRPDVPLAGTSCCRGCTSKRTGNMKDRGWTCAGLNATQEWTHPTRKCNTDETWREKKFCQLDCWYHGVGYEGDDCSFGAWRSQRVCGYETERVTFSAAQARCSNLGLEMCDVVTNSSPCYDESPLWRPGDCTHEYEVHGDGKVSMNSNTKFWVPWQPGAPKVDACPDSCTAGASSCICPVQVVVRQVFYTVPSASDLLARLKVGAFRPAIACTTCGGAVNAYSPTGSIDADTVFEYDGRFYKNVESVVFAGKKEFRNPPVFLIERSREDWAVRAALAEVESLLDHLVQHPNTPPFIAVRLIQRFVTSNPSPGYVKSVSEAFETGIFNGFGSGRRGDLAATMASVLLHDEARAPTSTTSGKLREPIIKLMHFLRAMEYVEDAKDMPHYTGDGSLRLTTMELDNVIGQEPYRSPSVFNFYRADYQPSRFSAGMVAPEFQIFTSPWALGFLNGVMSLIANGLSSCDDGFGTKSRRCSQGSLALPDPGSASAAVAELSLLLTGGRLGPEQVDVIEKAYESADDGKKMEAAQTAIVMTPEFNTLGEPQPSGERPPQTARQDKTPASYKATVMLFMVGGADTFNLIVPMECSLYDEYVSVREDMALMPGQLLRVSTAGQNCGRFGVHHSLPILKELYDEGSAAFVSNIGSLVEPTTKTQFLNHDGTQCVGLFSHSDQRIAAATLECQTLGMSPKGAGGRLADALAQQDFATASFSIDQSSLWSQGHRTRAEILDRTDGARRFNKYEELKTIFDNITCTSYRNMYSEEYTQQLKESVSASEHLGEILGQVTLKTSFEAVTRLDFMFLQVAKLIAARDARKAERDFFYVETGPYDAHSMAHEMLDAGFVQIDGALRLFIQELKAQGLFDAVTIVTKSDFGRTLKSNGAGTDHAWAGNHVVIGGAVKGGKIYNDYPSSLLEGNEADAGNGRMIPKYPWENMMVPIAEWMGMAQQHKRDVFPNIDNFNSSLILGREALFKT